MDESNRVRAASDTAMDVTRRSPAGPLELPASVFVILADLIRERLGLRYDADKRALLADKLTARIAARGLDSWLDYYYLLRYDADAGAEWLQVMDALAVQETYFWREMDQLRALTEVLLPRYLGAYPERPAVIWSAACASGEEPLSIAIALAEANAFARAPIRIVASDASPAALAKARQGIYRERSFRSLPQALRDKYFAPVAGGWRVDPGLLARIEWARVNLLDAGEVAPFLGAPFIFCRNTFIYFSDAALARVARRLYQGMPRPGYLFVGAAESLLNVAEDFDLQEIGGAFVYVKS